MTLDSIQKHLQQTAGQLQQLIKVHQQEHQEQAHQYQQLQQQQLQQPSKPKTKFTLKRIKQQHKQKPSWPPDEWFSHTTTYNHNHNHHNQNNHTKPITIEPLQPPPPPPTITNSPLNTLSLAPQPQPQTPTSQSIILNDSPFNTQSIPPTLNPSSSVPELTYQEPSTQLTPTHSFSHPPTSFRPPPIHPSRADHSKPIIVKETLDAQSHFSELGQKQVNQYLIKQEIGRGSFGAVQLAEDAETGLSYAIKELSKTRLKRKFARELMQINQPFIDHHHHDALFLIRNEVAIMKKIRHHNLVRLHEVLDVEGEDSLYIVMEYCPGGSLMRLVQESRLEKLGELKLDDQHQKQDGGVLNAGLDLDLARKYFRQLVAGIDYLHRNEIIHSDIKPDNLLLSSDKKQLKVVDFGISAMFVKPGDDSTVSRTIGTPAFLSPELINAANSDVPVSGTAADIWAMGVTLYFMLTGSLPFPSDQIIVMYEAVETQAPAIPDEWDGPLMDLMSRILDKQPASRIKMAELRGHEWVTNAGKLPSLSSGTLALSPSQSSLSSSRGKVVEENSEDQKKITEKDLKDSLRFGFTNRCPAFSELVDNALKLSSWKPSSCTSSHNQSHLLGRRKELFFKEFHRQISERTKIKFHIPS